VIGLIVSREAVAHPVSELRISIETIVNLMSLLHFFDDGLVLSGDYLILLVHKSVLLFVSLDSSLGDSATLANLSDEKHGEQEDQQKSSC